MYYYFYFSNKIYLTTVGNASVVVEYVKTNDPLIPHFPIIAMATPRFATSAKTNHIAFQRPGAAFFTED